VGGLVPVEEWGSRPPIRVIRKMST
jgi:hypothetical protein